MNARGGEARGWHVQGSITATRKLRVAYMLPHHNITGGMKCLVEHIRLLRERGHTTIAVHRCAASDGTAAVFPSQLRLHVRSALTMQGPFPDT